MRLIDAMAYRQVLEEEKNFTLDEDVNMGLEIVIADLVDAPTIEAEPVRHGRWDDTGRYTFTDGSLAIRCTECGAALHLDEWEKYHWNYCPNCGAKMDGDKHDTEG